MVEKLNSESKTWIGSLLLSHGTAALYRTHAPAVLEVGHPTQRQQKLRLRRHSGGVWSYSRVGSRMQLSQLTLPLTSRASPHSMAGSAKARKIIKYTDPEWKAHLVSGCCKQISGRKQNTAATAVSRFVSQGLALVSIDMDL